MLTIEGSGTPIEKRYREIAEAVSRATLRVETADITVYAPEVVERAREMWRVRMVAEHRSTSVFSAMAVQLMEANATLDAKALVLGMAQDELRHTELCGRVVQGLGAEARCEADLEVAPLTLHRGCSVEERALRNVIYGCCLSETVNAARFVDALETVTEPLIREATRTLLSDEVMHAQFGFYYLEAWRPWLEARPEVRASLGRYLRHAFAVLEQALAGIPGPHPPLNPEERALGLPDLDRLRGVFYETLDHAVVPGLENFGIAAADAWRTRSLSARPA